MTFREFVIKEFPDILEIMGYTLVSHYASAGIIENKQMSWYYHTYPEKEIQYPYESILKEIHRELSQRAMALRKFRRQGGIEEDDRYCIKKGPNWYKIIWSMHEKDLIRNEYGPYPTEDDALCEISMTQKPAACINERTGEQEEIVSLYDRLK
ncbi:MAG: hypothetical protein U9N62_13455 [Thermotogota bacterium]|nr:hypothetical protein [Thermotogota bacterium]